jgi:hypothetical protein
MPQTLAARPAALLASRSAYLKAVMLDEETKAAHIYPSLFNVASMSDWKETYQEMVGFGLNQQIVGEIPDTWPQDQISEWYAKSYTQVWYGNGVIQGKPFIKYDRDGIKGYEQGRGLVQSAHNTQEFYAASVFNNLTSTGTAYVLPDALALASTVHPLYDNLMGGTTTTFSNYVAATLDHDNLATAIYLMDTTPDVRGLPAVYTPKTLWCHPALVRAAQEVLQSNLRDDTSENAVNTLKGELTITPWRWLTSATNWGVQATKHAVNWKTGQGVEVEVWRDASNKSIHADVDQMFTFGVGDWRGMVVGNV